MSNPLVSIIVPVYNGENTIKGCIDSLLAQTYENTEIIIIDDESNDLTADICNGISDERVSFHVQKHGGVSFCRNSGINKSSGKYIMFMDSDDFISSEAVENMVNVAERGFELVVCGYKRVFAIANKEIEEYSHYKEDVYFDNSLFSERFESLSNEGSLIHVWGKLYRREIIENNNIRFDTDYSIAEDIMFNIDYLNCISKIAVFNKPYYVYNCYNGISLTKKINDDRFQIARHVYEKYVELLHDKSSFNVVNNTSLVRRYYKDCMNYLEQYEHKARTEKIKEIIHDSVHRQIVRGEYKYSPEFLLYHLCFKSESAVVIDALCKLRLIAKKMKRG